MKLSGRSAKERVDAGRLPKSYPENRKQLTFNSPSDIPDLKVWPGNILVQESTGTIKISLRF